MTHIKPVLRCPGVDKKVFKNSRCLLTISVGQEVHEGEKFAATVDLINESFNSCILLVGDTLQRHSMALNSPNGSNFFHKKALEEGNAWLQRNEKFYSKLTRLEKISRWDSWLSHPAYFEQEQKIKTLIASDSSYADLFQKTIHGFLERYCRRLDNNFNFCMKRAQKICFDYLLEECTALCFLPELECHFEIYHNRHNRAMEETCKRFVFPETPDLLHAALVKFKNRAQFQPQRFSTLGQEKAELE